MTPANDTKPAPRPTALNLSVLAECFGSATTIPNGRLTAVDTPHVRRCMKAGLLTATRAALTLTPAGVAALAERVEASHERAAREYDERTAQVGS